MSAMPRVGEFRFKVTIPSVDGLTWSQMVTCISGINDKAFSANGCTFHKGTCRLDLLSLTGRGVEAEITYRITGWEEASQEEMLAYADFSVFQRTLKEVA